MAQYFMLTRSLVTFLVLSVSACGSSGGDADGGRDSAMSDALDALDALDARDALDASMDAPEQPKHRVLFVGNSYIYTNDVSGHYRAIANELYDEVNVEEVTSGGYRLEQHAEDARTDDTRLARFLRTGTAEETDFTAVVLQEQSQIGGFPTTNESRAESVRAARELAGYARARDIKVIHYLTWGRERGAYSRTRFPASLRSARGFD